MSSHYTLTLPATTLEDDDPQAPDMPQTCVSGYTQFRSESGFTAVEQEVLFLAISRENGTEAHSIVADSVAKVPVEITNAIRDGNPIEDIKLAALVEFTRVMFVSRGHPGRNDVGEFLQAGYAESHILDIIVALAVKTTSNDSTQIFDTPVDAIFAARSWMNRTAA